MRKNKKKGSNKILKCFIILLIVLIIFGCVFFGYYFSKKNIKIYQLSSPYVQTVNECNLYDENNKIIGKVSSDIQFTIDSNYLNKRYLKIVDTGLFINYDDVIEIDKINEEDNTRYKNYIPYNLSIITNKDTKLYVNDKKYYIINNEKHLPIIIDKDDRYYTVFNNQLVYTYKNNSNTVEEVNSNEPIADKLAVLNYHFVISISEGEDKLCSPSSICHSEEQFSSHLDYLKNNDFYTITMSELEMFIDNNINLPQKSVAITIDDGWFVGRAIILLEKYDLMGTLFLIGSLAPTSDYASKNLEIHSHTWDLHNVSNCSGGRSALLCYDNNTIVEDLKKSRESLNNTTYFCYPFYEYNDHAIEALKQAGFTMALTDGNYKVSRNIDKFKVPRYVIFDNTDINTLSNYVN